MFSAAANLNYGPDLGLPDIQDPLRFSLQRFVRAQNDKRSCIVAKMHAIAVVYRFIFSNPGNSNNN